ncbi:hypothetical protein [Niallia circulans]|nr:hypothetical protein [Niallia circulans]
MPTKLDNYTFEDFGHIEEFGHVHPSTPEFEDKKYQYRADRAY